MELSPPGFIFDNSTNVKLIYLILEVSQYLEEYIILFIIKFWV